MKVFVSWSGKKSRDVARAFGDWLPPVLHAVEPFVSARDIRAGTRWQAEIASELDDTEFGLICVTKENQDAEWLNFEAGALAKSVDSSRVVPLAIDLVPADIANPLGQFQAIRLNKEDVTDLLISMNEACPSPITEENLRKAAEKWWPDLEEELTKIADRRYETEGAVPTPPRPDRDLLEEVLDSVRTLARSSNAAPRRPDMERINDLLRDSMLEDGHTYWGSRPAAGNRQIVQVQKAPGPLVMDAAREIEHRFGVDIEFELIDAEDH